MKAKRHGTRAKYLDGCRCDECRHAQALYQKRYRERRANGITRPIVVAELPSGNSQESVSFETPGPVELDTAAELAGLITFVLTTGRAPAR
jgi:hypothetical protein